jgi:hypothetical protein
MEARSGSIDVPIPAEPAPCAPELKMTNENQDLNTAQSLDWDNMPDVSHLLEDED